MLAGKAIAVDLGVESPPRERKKREFRVERKYSFFH